MQRGSDTLDQGTTHLQVEEDLAESARDSLSFQVSLTLPAHLCSGRQESKRDVNRDDGKRRPKQR